MEKKRESSPMRFSEGLDSYVRERERKRERDEMEGK